MVEKSPEERFRETRLELYRRVCTLAEIRGTNFRRHFAFADNVGMSITLAQDEILVPIDVVQPIQDLYPSSIGDLKLTYLDILYKKREKPQSPPMSLLPPRNILSSVKSFIELLWTEDESESDYFDDYDCLITVGVAKRKPGQAGPSQQFSALGLNGARFYFSRNATIDTTIFPPLCFARSAPYPLEESDGDDHEIVANKTELGPDFFAGICELLDTYIKHSDPNLLKAPKSVLVKVLRLVRRRHILRPIIDIASKDPRSSSTLD